MSGKVKVLKSQCECSVLGDADVKRALNKPGYHRVLWRCPNCRTRWIASGSEMSKHATSRLTWFFGWREV